MTTLVTTDAAPVGVTAHRTERVTFGGLLRSEWIKFWSVRSTIWTLSVTALVIIGLALLASLAMVNSKDNTNTPMDAFGGTAFLGPLAVAVLGALIITSEYSTGSVRSTFAAAPKRLPVIWAKAIVLSVVVFVVVTISVAVAAVLQWAIFQNKHFYIDASDPQIVRAMIGQGLYVTAIGLFAFALGMLLRQSAAAIATVLGVLLVLPILFQLIPWHVLHDLTPFLPNVAGSNIMQTDAQIAAQAKENPDVASLSAWGGFAVLLGYVALVMIPGAWRVKTRDA